MRVISKDNIQNNNTNFHNNNNHNHNIKSNSNTKNLNKKEARLINNKLNYWKFR
jgi:hypothetical protein